MFPFPLHVARIYFPGCAAFAEGGDILRLMNSDRHYRCLIVDNEEEPHQPDSCYGRDGAHRQKERMGPFVLRLLWSSLLGQVTHNQIGQRIGIVDDGLLKV